MDFLYSHLLSQCISRYNVFVVSGDEGIGYTNRITYTCVSGPMAVYSGYEPINVVGCLLWEMVVSGKGPESYHIKLLYHHPMVVTVVLGCGEKTTKSSAMQTLDMVERGS
jgi:hypothetical protein